MCPQLDIWWQLAKNLPAALFSPINCKPYFNGIPMCDECVCLFATVPNKLLNSPGEKKYLQNVFIIIIAMFN